MNAKVQNKIRFEEREKKKRDKELAIYQKPLKDMLTDAQDI